MSEARTATLRRMVLKFILDRMMAAKVVIDAEVMGALDPGDRKTVTLPDGTDVGTLSVTKQSTTTKVVNMAELEAWVRANHPQQIEKIPRQVIPARTQVYPAFVKKLTDECKVVDGEFVLPDTGEIVPGLKQETGDSKVSPRQTEKQLEAMLEAFESGQLRDVMLGVMATEPAAQIEEAK